MKKGIKSLGSLLLGGIIGGISGGTMAGIKLNKKVQIQQEYAQKHLLIMQTFNQWLMVKQEGKDLSKFFKDNGYKSIAIYGMSYLGERLLDELKDSEIEVKYAIDKNADNIYADIDVKELTDELPVVDAIVVTAVYFFDEIEEVVAKLTDYPIISLEDVLYDV